MFPPSEMDGRLSLPNSYVRLLHALRATTDFVPLSGAVIRIIG